jgi:hypothetical protein
MDDLVKVGFFGLIAYFGYQWFLSSYGPTLASSLNIGANYSGTGITNTNPSGSAQVQTNTNALVSMMGG